MLRLARLAVGLAVVAVLFAYSLNGRASGGPAMPLQTPTATLNGMAVPSAQQQIAGPPSSAEQGAPSPSAPPAIAAETPAPIASHATTPAVTPAGTPAAPVTPTPIPTPFVVAGSGAEVASFAYPGGEVRVLSEAVSASAAGCVYIGTVQAITPTVLSYVPSLTTTMIVLEAAGSGQGWVDLMLAPGSYQVVIDSTCDWQVTVSPR